MPAPAVKAVFDRALEIELPADREAYLAEACAGHPDVRQKVEALLRAYADAGSFLEPVPVAANASGAFRGAPADPATATFGPGNPALTADYPGRDEHAGATLGGRYKLVEAIGEGGMGSVFMALQTEPVKRAVAVKVIKAGMDSKAVLARFEAERQALAVMDHPHIAKVLDAGTTESGRPYFVMELVKGTPITQFCDERKLTPRQRLELFVPVCQAIQHAHQKGVIHRDIKPSNVLVALYDDRPVPKVIDFGVAKAAGQSLTDRTLMTGFGAVIGTPEYMSPEQASLNNLDVDTRSDVYSLGVLLYELLTGTTPVDRKSLGKAAVLEILRIVREVEPPRPSAKLSTIDTLPSVAANRGTEPAKLSRLMKGELDSVLLKALEKDRSRRYDSANGLAADVMRYLAGEPVLAVPPSTGYRLRKFVRRNRGWVGTVSVVAAVLVLATAVSVALAVRARDAEAVAQADRARAEDLARAESDARARAVEQTRRADDRAEDLASRLYIYRVSLAHREAVAGNIARADALLTECEPARRGWEWAYTRRLCHMETMSLGEFADHAAAVVGARRGPPSPTPSGEPSADLAVRLMSAVRGTVRGVAFSPDGRRIAAAHDDGTVGLYDARTGREVGSLTGHTGSVSCVAFDDTRRRLISGGFDRTVRVWDADTGKQKLVLHGHTRPVLRLAFRPGTDQAASCAHGRWEDLDGTGFEIKQWDLSGEGKEVRTVHHRLGCCYTGVAFSPDGRRLYSACVWGGFLRVWDPDTGKELEERRIPENSRGLAVSPTDGRVAYGSGTDVTLTDPKAGAGSRVLRGHTGAVLALAFSPDGTRLASAGEDGAVKLWAVVDGREIGHLRGHSGAVTAVAFGRDGNALTSSSEDGTAKVWDVTPGRNPFPLALGQWVTRVRFSPDGRRWAVANISTVTVADATSNKTVCQIRPPVNAGFLDFSRDGRLIATTSNLTGQAEVWDAETARQVAICLSTADKLRNVAFGPDGVLAAAGDDGAVGIWDAKTGNSRSVLAGHEGGAFGVAFDPTGTTLATIGWDGVVRLWDLPAGRQVRTLGTTTQRRSERTPDALAFSPDGHRLAVSSADGTVRVWEVATGIEVLTLRGHTQAVNGVAYSPDGRRIATWGDDYTIKLWNAATGDEVFTLRGHTGYVLGLAFSPDGNRILSTGADGTVRLWDGMSLPTGRPR